ncbi:O-antigen ligase family protein [Novosphingobium sp.]|uniref:O-antigen ligase family protein n=1 Tax=Novosphingobium sp. TaxID=1874826 RepID=UPI00286E70B7|nr:O-antigen ligase family protein [Novosphingobium sp.]
MIARQARAKTGMDALAALMPAGLIYTLFVPAGLTVEVGDLLFYASRVYLIVMLPFILAQCIRVRLHLRAFDYLVLAGVAWMVLSFLVNRGLSRGIESGGRDVIDILGTWFLARGCIRDEDDIARILKLILPGMLVVAGLLFIESVTGTFRVIDIFPLEGAIGTSVDQYRLGLLRAFGPFSHAILAGLFMSSFVTLYGMIVRGQISRWLGIAAGLSGFFTLSSAALAGLVLQAGFLVYRKIIKVAGYRTEWRPLALMTVCALALLQILSKGGAVATIIRYGAFDSQTGYFRLVIWEYGTASVARKPLFGFGYSGYDKPFWITNNSVDNHWLFLALRYGIPGFVLFFALSLFVIYRLGSISMKLPERAGSPYSAMMIILACATALGLTVAFVNEFQIWYIFMLGAASSMITLFDRRVALSRKLPELIAHSKKMRRSASA